jgi:hypothetical protein
MNMAGGGIVAFGDGGKTEYSNEGRSSIDTYRAYALAKATEKGVDPVLVDSIFKIESGYNPDAQSPTGPQGIGQLTKATGQAYGVKPEDRKDPYKNIDASIAFMADLNKKYDGDASKIAVAYNQGEGVLNKHLRANKGELNASTLPKEAQGYLKKLQKFAFNAMPGSEANAGELPTPQAATQKPQPRVVNGYEVDEFGIPGRKAGEPVIQSPEPTDDRSIFEKGADYVGIPQEFQRNFSNTLNAFGGGFGGAPRLARGIQSGAKALGEAAQATPEAIAAATAAAQKIANARIARPAAQGIENLTKEAQAMRKAAEDARLARALKTDTDAARATQNSVDQANETARLLRQQAEAADLAKATQVARANKVANAARINSGINAADAQMQRSAFAANDPRRTDARQTEALNTPASQSAVQDNPREVQSLLNQYPAPADDTQREVGSLLKRHPVTGAPTASAGEIAQAAKASTPPTADNEGWSGNDWLQFGLAMMAGQSPYALSNIGNAGLNVLASKTAREQEKNKLDMYKAIHAEKPGQSIQIAERLMAANPKLSFEAALAKATELTGGSTKQDVADSRAEAVLANRIKNYQAAVEKINGSLIGMRASGAKATPEAKKAYQDAIAALGPNPALEGMQQPAQTTAPAAVIPGAKIVGTR